ncbi:MAG: hypothetical protein RLZ10_965 [Bacteroidota bacterium]|jgi:hypothetical protein
MLTKQNILKFSKENKAFLQEEFNEKKMSVTHNSC